MVVWQRASAIWAKVDRGLRIAGAWVQRSKGIKGARSIAETLGKLTIFVGIVSYISEAPDRAKQRHYQAWQLMNSAKGPGDLGRRIALVDLVKDHVIMRRLDLRDANLDDLDLRSALLPDVNFVNAILDRVDFSCRFDFFFDDNWHPKFSTCWPTDLSRAKICTSFEGARFNYAEFTNAHLGCLDEEAPGRVVTGFFIKASHFVGAKLNGELQNVFLEGNNFSEADFDKSSWDNVTLLNGNSFVGAKFGQSFWYKVRWGTFLQRKEVSDFTNADLSQVIVILVNIRNRKVIFRRLAKGDLPKEHTILCRTKLKEEISMRDCK